MKRHLILFALVFTFSSICLPADLFGARLLSLVTCEQFNTTETVPQKVTDRFSPDLQVIHAVALFSHIEAGTVLTGKWVAVDAVAAPNYTFNSADVTVDTDGDANVHFSISKPTKGWPTGNFRFELFIEDYLIATAGFHIGAPSDQRYTSQPPQGQRSSSMESTSNDTGAGGRMASTKAADILGCWQCRTPNGLAGLVFHSHQFLTYGGESTYYRLVPGIIRVSDGHQSADYHYQMEGNQMTIRFPDRSEVFCERWECSSLITQQGQPADGASDAHDSGEENSEFVPPYYDGGSWETESDRIYNDDAAGYGGGAEENPNSTYYEYSNE